MARKRSRTWIIAVAGVLVAAILLYAFWPRAMPVDMGKVHRAAMVVTIDEEARTRVRDTYVVSAPITGRLLRVSVKPGDAVEGGRSVVFRMMPTHIPALDKRTREQARATVSAAEAALQAARADLQKAIADKEFAEAEQRRKRALRKRGTISEAALEQAERAYRAARANLNVAKAAIAVKQAELANARAQLMSFDNSALTAAPTSPPATPPPSQLGMTQDANTIPITAPTSGRILRVIQESETTVNAGTPILEIGNIANDLEVLAELLSTDAVQVAPGYRVLIRKWGGGTTLNGVVERVEPWGFTKTSALGVEEQRVKTLIRFTDPPEKRRSLGHGFRVEVQIVIYEKDDALVVPSSALFRQGANWAVFVATGGRAKRTIVNIGRNNGTIAEVTDGLKEGTDVILYPGPTLAEGQRITRRTVSKAHETP